LLFQESSLVVQTSQLGDVVLTTSLDVREGRICRVFMVRNPEKLGGIA